MPPRYAPRSLHIPPFPRSHLLARFLEHVHRRPPLPKPCRHLARRPEHLCVERGDYEVHLAGERGELAEIFEKFNNDAITEAEAAAGDLHLGTVEL